MQKCYIRSFQPSLFLEIRTLVTWVNSTLLLKIKCFEKHIYKKTDAAFVGMENAWEAGGVGERVWC